MANDVKTTTSRSKRSTTASTTKSTASGNATDTKVSKPAAAKPQAARKPRASSGGTDGGAQITAADRLRHIEMAAYYLAERRGFCDGNPADDWYAAERQIDHLLLAGKLAA